MKRLLLSLVILVMASVASAAIPCYMGFCDFECNSTKEWCECASSYRTWCTMAKWECEDVDNSVCCPAEFAVF